MRRAARGRRLCGARVRRDGAHLALAPRCVAAKRAVHASTQMRLTSAVPRRAARAPSFTCAEACAATAAAASPPLELDGGARPWCDDADGADDAGRALAQAQAPPPLTPPEVDALHAVWQSIDAAFKARARARA
jgi:hypothetical protein